MKNNKKKANKLKINKGQLAVKIMAGILALMMVLSVFGTLAFYIFSYMA